MSEPFLTGVGRLVQGDCFEPQTKDQQGNPRVIKTGPNAGQLNPQFYIGVAFAKNDPAWPEFWAVLDRVARATWPQFFPSPTAGCSNPNFAFKVIDGDGIDKQGRPHSAKEGFAGCWVVRFTSGFAPRCFHAGHYAENERITDPKMLRRGYYVRVSGNVRSNENPSNPGLYLNFDLVELSGHGAEITSGPDAASVFGASAPVLPPGASATPIAAAPVSTAARPFPPTIGSPAPMAGPGPAPSAPAPSAPPPAPAAPPAAPPPGKVLTALGQASYVGATYAGYIAAGWTDDQLRAQGYLV